MGTNKRYYRARGVHAVLGESSTGKEQVAVTLQILDEGATHQQLTWYGFFTDATWERTIESLRTLGWQGDDLNDLTGIDRDEVSITVEDEEYNGQVYTRVKWINKAGGPAVKSPLTGDRAASFAAQMKAKIRALDAQKKQLGAVPVAQRPVSSAPHRPVAPHPPPAADFADDIPF